MKKEGFSLPSIFTAPLLWLNPGHMYFSICLPAENYLEEKRPHRDLILPAGKLIRKFSPTKAFDSINI